MIKQLTEDGLVGVLKSCCTTPVDRIRALDGRRPIRPTSTGYRRSRQPEPGRCSTYRPEIPVQTNGASSLAPVRRALGTVANHVEHILQRWNSSHSNARLEGMNGIFQAARSRARGYRYTATYITIIYLLGAPLPDLINSI